MIVGALVNPTFRAAVSCPTPGSAEGREFFVRGGATTASSQARRPWPPPKGGKLRAWVPHPAAMDLCSADIAATDFLAGLPARAAWLSATRAQPIGIREQAPRACNLPPVGT